MVATKKVTRTTSVKRITSIKKTANIKNTTVATKKTSVIPVRKKVLTAEGWKRRMLEQAKPAPKKTKK